VGKKGRRERKKKGNGGAQSRSGFGEKKKREKNDSLRQGGESDRNKKDCPTVNLEEWTIENLRNCSGY